MRIEIMHDIKKKSLAKNSWNENTCLCKKGDCASLHSSHAAPDGLYGWYLVSITDVIFFFFSVNILVRLSPFVFLVSRFFVVETDLQQYANSWYFPLHPLATAWGGPNDVVHS